LEITFKNRRKPRKGRLLLADPFFMDEYFTRAVIYICEHNTEGSFGFVLTNYLEIDLHEVAKNFPELSTKVSLGGPVQTDNIYFLHTLGDKIKDSQLIDDGIYVGGNYDQLISLIQKGEVTNKDVRFFLGYSGWTSNQLTEEINDNAWVVVPVLNPREVMDFSINNLWENLMRREGKNFEILAQAPNDISLN
jgi:putative transcriptional regulator